MAPRGLYSALPADTLYSARSKPQHYRARSKPQHYSARSRPQQPPDASAASATAAGVEVRLISRGTLISYTSSAWPVLQPGE